MATQKRYLPVCLFCVVFMLSACSGLDRTEMQQCMVAIDGLKSLENMHYISTTYMGESADSLEVSAVSEYWINGKDWAYRSELLGSGAIWQLTLDNETFAAMESEGKRLWQAATEGGRETESWVPSEDFSLYRVTSVKKENGSLVITMTSDVAETTPAAYGNATYKDYQVVVTLDPDGGMEKYERNFCSTVVQADGNTGDIYWKHILEYPDFTEEEITDYLHMLYQEANANAPVEYMD